MCCASCYFDTSKHLTRQNEKALIYFICIHFSFETNFWQLQTYAVLFSKIGNYKASLATQNLYLEKNKAAMNIPVKPKADSVYFRTFKPKNAVDVIAKAAENYKVVITNEAHYQPENRVFTNV